jgi:hypothetical protein
VALSMPFFPSWAALNGTSSTFRDSKSTAA